MFSFCLIFCGVILRIKKDIHMWYIYYIGRLYAPVRIIYNLLVFIFIIQRIQNSLLCPLHKSFSLLHRKIHKIINLEEIFLNNLIIPKNSQGSSKRNNTPKPMVPGSVIFKPVKNKKSG